MKMKTISWRFNEEETPRTEQLKVEDCYVTFAPKIKSRFREEKDEFEYCLYSNMVNKSSEWIDKLEI